MTIDKIVKNISLPNGEYCVAALRNRNIKSKKRQDILKNLPRGIARTRSYYSSEHIVIPLSTCLFFGWPYITTRNFTVKN